MAKKKKKKTWKDKLADVVYSLPGALLLRKTILFESNPCYQDNTRAVFDELVRRGLNRRYRMVWLTANNDRPAIPAANTIIVDRNLQPRERLWYQTTARMIIDCNRYVQKRNKHQIRIHLTHGVAPKDVSSYFRHMGVTDYVLQLSDFFTKETKRSFRVTDQQILTMDFPRCDVFFRPEERYTVLPERPREKTIVWLPTYRNNMNAKPNHKFNTALYHPYGVPGIGSEEQLLALNDRCREKKVLLLIKLHPVEDRSHLRPFELSNVVMLEENVYRREGKTVYDVLTGADAMITDYSSIYYEFLLTDRPIALACGDLEAYREKMNFVVDYEKDIVGRRIMNFEDLTAFVDEVAAGVDPYLTARREKKFVYNRYGDGRSAKRLADLILEKLGEK